MKRAPLLAPLLALVFVARARGEEGVAAVTSAGAPPRQRSMDTEKEDAGFGQDADEPPRIPRIRIELSAMGAIFDCYFREGKAGLSDRFDVESDAGLPRFTPGFLVAGQVKLHRYIALGAQYFLFSVEGPRSTIRHDLRLGNLPAEFPPYSDVKGTMALQQATMTFRFVAADDNEIRAEFAAGFTWVSMRVGIHPQAPAPPPYNLMGQQPGGGYFTGVSERAQAWLAPTLGTFFAWNFHPDVAAFVDTTSAYFSFYPTFGSLATIDRLGLRFKVWNGLEIVTAMFVVSGQVYDIKNRFQFAGTSSDHTYHQASWFGGGPELGVSFTY